MFDKDGSGRWGVLSCKRFVNHDTVF
jgi:hypothetical protein